MTWADLHPIESGNSFPPALALASTDLRRRGSPDWEPPQISSFLARGMTTG